MQLTFGSHSQRLHWLISGNGHLLDKEHFAIELDYHSFGFITCICLDIFGWGSGYARELGCPGSPGGLGTRRIPTRTQWDAMGHTPLTSSHHTITVIQPDTMAGC